MTLMVPHCFKRRCKHYKGVAWQGAEERTERNVCAAFSNGIPDEITYGSNLHMSPVRGDHGIQYERDDGTNELYRPS